MLRSMAKRLISSCFLIQDEIVELPVGKETGALFAGPVLVAGVLVVVVVVAVAVVEVALVAWTS